MYLHSSPVLSSILVLAATGSIRTVDAVAHQIRVGARGALRFEPAELTAAVGDTLEFKFYNPSGPHNVVSGDFASPCTPKAGAFFSGDIDGDSNGDATFIVRVTSTDPIWYYCSEARHCQSGMAGVINPPSGQTIASYIQAARRVPQAEEPDAVAGGVVTSLGGGSSPSTSSSSSSPASSTVVLTSTAAATSTSTSVSVLNSSSSGSGSGSGTTVRTTSQTATTGGGAVVTSASNVVANSGTPATSSPSATTTANVGVGRQSEGMVLGALAAVLGGFVALMA